MLLLPSTWNRDSRSGFGRRVLRQGAFFIDLLGGPLTGCPGLLGEPEKHFSHAKPDPTSNTADAKQEDSGPASGQPAVAWTAMVRGPPGGPVCPRKGTASRERPSMTRALCDRQVPQKPSWLETVSPRPPALQDRWDAAQSWAARARLLREAGLMTLVPQVPLKGVGKSLHRGRKVPVLRSDSAQGSAPEHDARCLPAGNLFPGRSLKGLGVPPHPNAYVFVI